MSEEKVDSLKGMLRLKGQVYRLMIDFSCNTFFFDVAKPRCGFLFAGQI